MRTILFRGQRITGEWIYGSLIIYGERACIYPVNGSRDAFHFYGYEVIPETVGEFTGILDKNGKQIFEGDRLKTDFMAQYIVEDFQCFFEWLHTDFYNDPSTEIEIIGNIHDK